MESKIGWITVSGKNDCAGYWDAFTTETVEFNRSERHLTQID
jgi:hypothetical protein